MSIQSLPSKWGPPVLVCRKCGKKLGGGFGKKGRHALADELHDALRQTGRRRALRVVETGCLGLCPKGGVALALPDRLLVVAPATPAEDVLAEALRGPIPSGPTPGGLTS